MFEKLAGDPDRNVRMAVALGRVVNLSQSVSKRLFPSLPRKRE